MKDVSSPLQDSDDVQSWERVRTGLIPLMAGLESGEVIELAAVGDFYLEVGRLPAEIWLLASGPPTPELRAGQVVAKLRRRLVSLGFQPPDGEKPSWWYAVALPAQPADLELAAAQVVAAFQEINGVTAPDDLVWSHVVASDATRALAADLGIPRSPAQNV